MRDLREVARDTVAKCLAYTTGKAQDVVAELRDAEVQELVDVDAAGYQPRRIAVQLVKDILARAYDRRRETADVAEQVKAKVATQSEPPRAAHTSQETLAAAVRRPQSQGENSGPGSSTPLP